jgi:hypothetical protein
MRRYKSKNYSTHADNPEIPENEAWINPDIPHAEQEAAFQELYELHGGNVVDADAEREKDIAVGRWFRHMIELLGKSIAQGITEARPKRWKRLIIKDAEGEPIGVQDVPEDEPKEPADDDA